MMPLRRKFQGLIAAGAASAACAMLLLSACMREPTQVAGGWSDTETGQKVSGIIRLNDGRPAVGALVQLRPNDYLGRDPASGDSVGVSASHGSILDGICDSSGRYVFDSVAVGQYTLESRYQEINSVVAKFPKASDKRGVEVAAAYVKRVGSITGRVFFSDGVQGPVLVRIYGLERAAYADNSTGVYTFGNIPEGAYTLRFSSLEPSVSAMEKTGVRFAAGSGVNAGETVMIRGLRQPFDSANGYLEIPGVDSANPVILENGEFRGAVDGAYLWAKASMGHMNLRGTITSYGRDTGEAALRANVASCQGWIDLAEKSGMRLNMIPVAGARHKLAQPRSGNLQDIAAESTEGSMLLIGEAHKATAARPLVLICAANLTTAAQALLIDPSIADRMVVIGAGNGGLNSDDSLALAVVAKKGRFIAWARRYIWDSSFTSVESPPLFPTNRFGEALRKQFEAVSGAPFRDYSYFGDFGAATFLFQKKVWKTGVTANLKYPGVGVEVSVPAPYDFVDVPSAGTDFFAIEAEFYGTMTDPAAYHPWPVAEFKAETYANESGIVIDSNASEKAAVGAWKPGSWAEYKVQVDAAGDYAMEIRYQADSTSTLKISDASGGASVTIDLPGGPAWSTVTAPLPLPLNAGVRTLRLESLQGAFNVNRIQAR